MVWLRFRMNLKQSTSLLTGKLAVIDNNKIVSSFLVTSGLPGYQNTQNQSYRGRGPLPACKKIGIDSYSVNTQPINLSATPGVEGAFYGIEPFSVTVDRVQRGDFGIHFGGNTEFGQNSTLRLKASS